MEAVLAYYDDAKIDQYAYIGDRHGMIIFSIAMIRNWLFGNCPSCFIRVRMLSSFDLSNRSRVPGVDMLLIGIF